ncbi:MAG: MarR family winged helix-turn-helix transcriptional regulator [Candidatus Methanomethylophilaceae archaeon]
MEDYAEDVGLKIKRINELIYRHSNEGLAEWDVTMTQCRILSILSAQPGERATQRCLEQELCVSHPTVVGVIRRLNAKGLVEIGDQKGNLSKEITLTESGLQTIDGVESWMHKMEDTLLNGLSAQERDNLIRMLDIIYSNSLKLSEGDRSC